MESEPTAPPSRSIDETVLRTWFRYGTGFVSLVLVALFIQKSDGNSAAGTLFYLGLGSVGSLLITAGAVGIRFRRYSHNHRHRWFFSRPPLFLLAGLLGLVLLRWSFIGIDENDSVKAAPDPGGASSYSQPRAKLEGGTDSKEIALRNLTIAENDEATRLLVTLVNKSRSSVLVDRAALFLKQEGPGNCAGDFPIYRLDNKIVARDGRLRDEKLLAEAGPLKGFSVKVSGQVEFFCDDISLELRFPVSMDLPPNGTTNLAVDIPRDVRLILEDMILFNPSNRSKYPIGSRRRVDLHFGLEETRKQAVTVVSFRVGYEATESWACVAKRIDELPPNRMVSGPNTVDQLKEVCRTDEP